MARLYQIAFIFSMAATLLTVRAADTVYFAKYFPKGVEHWYSTNLATMKEPSLYEQRTDKNVEQYRFLWLRTFDKPIAVRIQKDNAGVTLRVIRLSGEGGYDPGQIDYDESLTLTTNQWDEFTKLLEKASFWKLPTDEKDAGGLDGSQWVLEGQAAGKYHVVDRWTPAAHRDKRHLDDFVACCRYLLKLSKQEISKKEDY
jgi:hypothetical protein